ncbi:MAG TPA: lysylphosphatidylglycerol synthase domain-containing protein [Verrucomicrobiae bacterium]|nr:lysylphosphatidylglycerol synthase domain-containing protein [Verrucomicrobiae bacterium]
MTALFVGLIGWLIWSRASAIDWDRVGAALARYEFGTLLMAGALAALSFALYAGYDLLSRAHTRHDIPRRSVAAMALVVYAFNHNFGAWIGSLGMRYRLYSRYGVKPGIIGRVVGMSIATNWLGYLTLAGMIFVLRLAPLPAGWRLGADGLQLIGLLMLVAAASYLVMCASSRKRVYRIGGAHIHLPPLRLALAQLMLSLINWLAISLILFTLLEGRVPVHTVVAVLLLASIASIIAHIPGGLGVIEAVCLALLTPKLSETTVLAALLAYRAINYLAPLLVALVVYAALEHRARGGRLHRAHPRASAGVHG